jgi:anti-anti-sigma factor
MIVDPFAPADVTVFRKPDTTIITLRGEIDLSTAESVRQQIRSALPTERVILNLAGVTFMDSSGLAVVLDLFHQLGQSPDALTLQSPSPAVGRLLQVTGVDRHLSIA